MGSDSTRAAIASNRNVSSRAPHPRQDCRDVIHIAIFFDGTGNNFGLDAATSKWSNVGRLFQSAEFAAQEDKSRTNFPIYISGVGTPYNGSAADWLASAVSWIEDKAPGAGAGAGGARRLVQGTDSVNDRLRDALIANAKARGGSLHKYARENSNRGLNEINAAVAKHRLIKVINLSIFGFSRGAAPFEGAAGKIYEGGTRWVQQRLKGGFDQ